MGLIIKSKADWTSSNPTLKSTEYGMESDTGHVKKGDNTTAWVDLAYYELETDFTRIFLNELQSIVYNAGTPIADKSAAYDMVYTDGIIMVTTGASDVTIKLPRPSLTDYDFNGVTMQRIYQVVKKDSGAGRVKLIPFSGLILGETEQYLVNQFDNFTFYSNGTDYFER